MHKILIVDDEDAARYGIRRALESSTIRIFEAASASAARRIIQEHQPQLMLADINMPDEDGISLVKSLADLPLRPLAIMITAYATAKVAVDAMKAGAYDYLTKPFEIDELRLVVKRALEKMELEQENRDLRKQIVSDGQFGRLLGKSARMQHLFATADQVAAADVTVLIHGESGTGKELLAREMHDRSPRKKAAFVAVNCAALPDTLIESELFGHEKGAFTGASEQRKGKFELAHGGTLFLDEIGDMNPLTQAKVLRAIEERRIERLGGAASIACDVRLISATHKDLSAEVEAGRFRQDLFYRLKVVTLEIPALRQHREDLPLLIRSFVSMFAARHKKEEIALSSEALERLAEHAWPGNVRELRNVIEGCVVLNRSGAIQVADLPVEVRSPARTLALNIQDAAGADSSLLALPYKEAKRKFEVEYIAARLQENNGNVSRTAAQIGLHRQSLQQKLRELGIER
ncbi:MAG: sigma-54 dependent transcriptional regulator [Acidobacteria bacterium]|nr:sigma-54 dependent transcriptional regulator [Acidobacteriota bacterium]MCI0626293.1 sigma-54 dependent transcriptional regulator [Acidobacteriota bacterium]MCI0720776.1 sigma-54 dependent transcriptional regulator [Acidobacteriota bacterium]